jgi:hypothetical protein
MTAKRVHAVTSTERAARTKGNQDRPSQGATGSVARSRDVSINGDDVYVTHSDRRAAQQRACAPVTSVPDTLWPYRSIVEQAVDIER